MRKIKLYLIVLLASVSLTFSSCSDDDHKPKGQFETGIFVANEGNFSQANGSVSFIDPTTKEVSNDLFGSINSGRALGDVVQSISVDGDFAYIVVNNSNRMEVVNANTFEASYTVEGLKLPRYFTTLNGKGYVTEWVNFSDPGRVAVIDLQNHIVTGTITTDYGAENIIAVNGKLYVSNNATNSVSVIDPSSAQVVKTIEVGNSPGAFAIDTQNKLWVICGGSYDTNFTPLNDGKMVQIDPASNSITKTISLHVNVTPKMAINKSRNQLFYYKGKSVYRVAISDINAPTSALVTESSATSFYGIGIDPKTDILYAADAKGFTANGKVFTYSTDGVAQENFNVGIGPNGFAFK
jgi:YVTN family beta-propeller protein